MRRAPRGQYRCEHCDGLVQKGFSHWNPRTGRITCKPVNWKLRALKAERELGEIRTAIEAVDRVVDDNDWEDCVAFYGEVRRAAGLGGDA